MTMILIVTGEDDVHADRVQAELERRDAEVARFDPAWFPAEAAVSVAVGSDGAVGGRLGFRGREIELERIGAVWRRRPGQPVAASALTGSAAAEGVEGEAAAVLPGLWGLPYARHRPASPPALPHPPPQKRPLLLA